MKRLFACIIIVILALTLKIIAFAEEIEVANELENIEEFSRVDEQGLLEAIVNDKRDFT